ncbi:MAG: bifunctional UDP-N-acetylglucosamine diphosphorylase/glucosamine-1-phosphate N-acetyltransferase GlmU [Chloroflexi bacterium]|nr:bifunctional UDP-N-acetylglucosamine diphosphorylase/glucosamine-1-phosphate N-acetyltransferase GlmU [Chloroflexota bacterium]
MKTTAVLLAAGKGTRMRSRTPKALHPLGGLPMLRHSLEALAGLTSAPPVVVIGHGAEAVQAAVGASARCVVQAEQLGTGHAVMQAAEILAGQSDLVLVAQADMPLIRAATYQRLIETQQANPGAFSMLTVIAEDPRGFGRILRKPDGSVQAIIEDHEAAPEQKAIRELNVGGYCFNAAWLWASLERIPLSAKGEYYLTDLVRIANDEGMAVQALVMDDPQETIGINTRVHLAEAEAILRARINRAWMEAGVTLVDPATTYIESGVRIGADTVIHPSTSLRGQTVIGAECVIGPNTLIADSQVGDACTILASVVESARLERRVEIGPYAHLRKGAHLAEGVHMGNFGEVKNAYLGPGVKMGHFSYIGDATIGRDVNIGAGTITANYDGEKKNHTEIDEGAFIGSDTMLVAPLRIGKRARTGAGSVVTKDVPDDTVVVGIPARAIRKLK